MLIHLLLSLFAPTASAKVVTYNWNLGWVSAAPDGFVRPVIGINGQFPLPTIDVNLGDQLVINVANNLANTSATLHFHGLYQMGNTLMDGPSMVTQCPIAAGQNLTYNFPINQAGTYFYHSHFAGQYPDGLRGALIVHDPSPPFKFDVETVVTLSDWYHDQMSNLENYYLSNSLNAAGPEPIPVSILINDAQQANFNVLPGKTYFFRIINFSAFSQIYFKFDQHQMTIVEIDGVYTQPRTVDTLYVAAAQRYGVLLTTKSSTSKNYPGLAKLDERLYDGYNTTTYTAQVNTNANANLVYNSAVAQPAPLTPTLEILASQVIDDITLVPYDKQPLLQNPTQQFVLEIDFFSQDGQNSGNAALNNKTYGVNANAMVLNYNEVIEVVINNADGGSHPIHIHGHAPQLVARSSSGTYTAQKHNHIYNPAKANPNLQQATAGALGFTGKQSDMPATPMRRDTWMLAANGYTVIRFKANNPGVWFFHCHMDWHNIAGLAATFVEAPLQLQKQIPTIPAAWSTACQAQGFSAAGNAGGNTKNFTDLSNANTVCPLLGT